MTDTPQNSLDFMDDPVQTYAFCERADWVIAYKKQGGQWDGLWTCQEHNSHNCLTYVKPRDQLIDQRLNNK